MKQQSFSSLEYSSKKKRTKREKFLDEMDSVVPWARLEALIEPYSPKPGKGRPPFFLSAMLRIYFLQQWYALSDPGAEEALYDIESMRRFAGFDLTHDAIPDETTILHFRHLLEKHDLTDAIFVSVRDYLEDKKLLLRGGTIMDATLIPAPSSTKNKEKKRDPEMTSSKKGNQWHFGMKAHIGVDAQSGMVHVVGNTTGSVHDAKVMDELIREDDKVVFGDKGYVNEKKKKKAGKAGVRWAITEKKKPKKQLSSSQQKRNKKHGSMRTKVEHVFRVVKCQFGYRKTLYRGIEKNGCQMFSLMALANLYMARRQLLEESA